MSFCFNAVADRPNIEVKYWDFSDTETTIRPLTTAGRIGFEAIFGVGVDSVKVKISQVERLVDEIEVIASVKTGG